MTASDIVRKVEEIKEFDDQHECAIANLKHNNPNYEDEIDGLVKYATEYVSLLVEILDNTECNLNMNIDVNNVFDTMLNKKYMEGE